MEMMRFGLCRKKKLRSCAVVAAEPPIRSWGITTGALVAGRFSSPERFGRISADVGWKARSERITCSRQNK